MFKMTVSVAGVAVDYSQYVDQNNVQISEAQNDVGSCAFSMTFSNIGVTVPPARAYVRIYSTSRPNSLWTGFITNNPTAEFLSLNTPTNVHNGQLFRYDFQASTDDYLLNCKAIPFIPAFINQTQGAIIKKLAAILCPNFFDVTQVADGDLVPYFLYDPSQGFSQIVKTFADGSRFRFKARDKMLFYQQYGDQYMGLQYNEYSQPQSQIIPLKLTTKIFNVPIVNDITIIGDTEAGNNREDYFIGDGFTANFQLRHKMFRGASSLLLQETWANSSLNTQQWNLLDPGTNFDTSVGALNLVSASGVNNFLGDSVLTVNNGIEIGGGIDFEGGEFTFNDINKGIIGGIYSNSLFLSGMYGGATSQSVSELMIWFTQVYSQAGAPISGDFNNPLGNADQWAFFYNKIQGVPLIDINTNQDYLDFFYPDGRPQDPFNAPGYTASEYIALLVSGGFTPSDSQMVQWDYRNLTASGLVAGYLVSSPSGVGPVGVSGGVPGVFVQAFANGAPWGDILITRENHNYVLQMTANTPVYSRYQRTYRTVLGQTFGGVQVTATGDMSFFVQDYDIPASTGFFYTPDVTKTSVPKQSIPTVVLYGLINNLYLNLTDSNTTIATMPLGTLQAVEGPSGLQFPTGSILPMLPPGSGGYIGGVMPFPGIGSGNILPPPLPLTYPNGQASLVMGNGFELQDAQITPGNSVDTLAFYAQSIPAAGTPVRLQSWEAQASISRVQDPNSINVEAFIVGDDGIRSAISRDLNPLPRTSEDCDAAASAFLTDRILPSYDGGYEVQDTMANPIFIRPNAVQLAFYLLGQARGYAVSGALVPGFGAGNTLQVQQWQFFYDQFMDEPTALDPVLVTGIYPDPTTEVTVSAFLASLLTLGNQTSLPGITGDVQWWPCAGRFLHVNAPKRGLDTRPLLVTKLDISFQDWQTETLTYTCTFTVDTHLEKLLHNLVPSAPPQILTPQDKVNPPNPQTLQTVATTYLPDLNHVQAMLPQGITATGVQLQVLDPLIGPIEVRRSDQNWGRGKTSNWIETVTPNASGEFTLTRQQFDQVWYLRPISPGSTNIASGMFTDATEDSAPFVSGQYLNAFDWTPYYNEQPAVPQLATTGTLFNTLFPAPATLYTSTEWVQILLAGGVITTNGAQTSRRSKVIRVRYPTIPAPPLFVSSNAGVVQFNFAGDIRSIYGFELRTPPKLSLESVMQSMADAAIANGSAPPYVDGNEYNAYQWTYYYNLVPGVELLLPALFVVIFPDPLANITLDTYVAALVESGLISSTALYGQQVILQVPALSFASLNVDIFNQTSLPFVSGYPYQPLDVYAYFFNHQWEYSDPTIIDMSSANAPGLAPFNVVRQNYAVLTIIDTEIVDNENVGQLTSMNFFSPAIDDTDAGWCAGGSMSATGASALIPYSVTGTSRYGPDQNNFIAGDYVVWNDPVGGYEIDNVIGVTGLNDGTGSIELSRNPLGASGTDVAYLGSFKGAHDNARFYKVIPTMLSSPSRADTFGTRRIQRTTLQAPITPDTSSAIPAKYEWVYANKCVLSVLSQAIGSLGYGPVHTLNLASGIVSATGIQGPPAPGFRTMNGAAYFIGAAGDLGSNQTADFRARVQAWESIRTVYATVNGVVLSDTLIAVVYITPDGTQAALLDVLSIPAGSGVSFPLGDPPDGRNMPYHNGWTPTDQGQYDWPPTLLPLLDGALNGAGVLTSTGTLDTTVAIPYQPDGQLDFIMVDPGGTDLVITIQT